MTCGLHPIDEHILHYCADCKRESPTCEDSCKQGKNCEFVARGAR